VQENSFGNSSQESPSQEFSSQEVSSDEEDDSEDDDNASDEGEWWTCERTKPQPGKYVEIDTTKVYVDERIPTEYAQYGRIVTVGKRPSKGQRERGPDIRIRPCNENGLSDEDDSEEDEEGISYATYSADCLIPRDINSAMSGSTNEDSDVTKLRSPTARELSRSPTARQKIVKQLVSMGYDQDSASRATESTGAVSVEAAVEQLLL
jgi:hypothetical protein